jgi:hypothetical protein
MRRNTYGASNLGLQSRGEKDNEALVSIYDGIEELFD